VKLVREFEDEEEEERIDEGQIGTEEEDEEE
jgi:hypothetical protein